MIKKFFVLVLLGFICFSVLEAYDYYGYSKPRNYRRGGEIYLQDGYFRNDYEYIAPHIKTYPDQYEWNNLKPRISKMYRGLYDW